MGTPAGSSHSGAMTGHWRAGTVKRAFGWAALRGARQPSTGAGASRSPRPGVSLLISSHQTSPSGVMAQLVKMASRPSVRMAFGFEAIARAGRHAEEAGLRVDRVQAAVGADLHPGDVVADGLDLPARDGRLHHREVGLAAGRGEGGGDVVDVARPGS